ncbi:MAG: pantetheine-phosphate adenylyltransferase [Anaerolineae bacterium]|jgi:pantetheine-phosphate adenylyltransferase
MSRIALFPATFDPVTNGHVSIAERSAALFDELVVGVYAHEGASGKAPLFTLEERVELARDAVAHIENARVAAFDGLAVEFARDVGAQVVVRGLRVADDFEFERQMAMMNGHLAPEIETMLLISKPAHAFVSASLVREVAMMGGEVSDLVPPSTAAALDAKFESSTMSPSTQPGE